MLALAVALTLVPPLPGAVARGFEYAGDPFARGHHRGIDLAARPGARVRAACSGRVTFAGRAGADGRAVTIRCGAWSVTHLPLRELAVSTGERVPAGATLGAAAASREHAGLHLGVRRTIDPLGYVDPAPLLRTATPPPPPVPPPRATRPPPPRPGPSPSAPHPTHARQPGSSRAPTTLAPWPAWAGLALLLSGALGAGRARATRRRRAPLTRLAAREVR